MASSDRLLMPYQTAFDAAGDAAPGAKLNFYVTATTTRKDTYSDAALSVPNANPLPANSAGRFGTIYLGSGDYKIVLTDENDVELWSADPVSKSGTNSASTTVAGIIEIATEAEALLGTSTSLAIVPDTAVAMIQQGFTYGGTVGGTANAITVTPSILPAALAAGMKFTFKATATNTSTTTINYAALGVVAAKVTGGSGATACSGGEIISGNTYEATYSSSDACWLIDAVGFTPAAANAATTGTSMAPGDKILMYDLSALAPRAMTLATLFPFASKTANYTVVDNDCGGAIRFSGLSANVTLTLPAVSGRAGFMITVINQDGVYAVTVDGNASETIDGFTTRKSCGREPIRLYCDGSAWYTVSGRWVSISAEYTLSASTLTTYAHGLGVTPSSISFICECLSADAGYAVGEFLILGYNLQSIGSGSAMYGWITQADATNVYLRCTASQFGTVVNKSSFLQSNMTYGNWSVRIVATE